MGYGLDVRGSIPGRGMRFFFYPRCPDRLWGPPTLLFNGVWGLFLQAVKRPGREAFRSLTLVLRSQNFELYFHSPTRFNGVMLN